MNSNLGLGLSGMQVPQKSIINHRSIGPVLAETTMGVGLGSPFTFERAVPLLNQDSNILWQLQPWQQLQQLRLQLITVIVLSYLLFLSGLMISNNSEESVWRIHCEA